MPNYKTHDTIGYVSAPFVGVITYAIIDRIDIALGVTAAYVFSTLFLSPDLDADSRIYKRWLFLRFIWYPYKQIIPHRSVFSHSGPFSAILRLVYLIAVLAVLLSAAFWILSSTLMPDLTLNALEGRTEGLGAFILCLLIGAVLADIVHCVADFLTS